MTPAERMRAYRARIAASEGRPVGRVGRPPGDAVHGSAGAWRRHQRAGEPICDACRAWRTEYMQDRRQQQRKGTR